MGLFNFGKKKEKLKPAKPEKIKNKEPKNDIEWVKKNYPNASEAEQQKILAAMSGGGFNPLDTDDAAVQKEITTKKPEVKVTWTETIDGKTQQVEVDDDFDDDKFQDDLEHLTPKGDIPWGWYSANVEFTSKTETERRYFSDMLSDNKKEGNPYKIRDSLLSLVQYLEDCKKLYKSKGEVFELWFNDVIADQKYIDGLKFELNELDEDFDRRVAVYEYMKKIPSFKDAVIETIKNNEGILQKDLKSYFMDEPEVWQKVSFALYQLTKEGKIEKVKQGRCNVLKVKE